MIKIYQKRRTKKNQQQKKTHDSTNNNQLSGKLIAMSFVSFSLSIVVDLFSAKIAGYTFIWKTY